MRILKQIKNNFFSLCILIVYMILFVINPPMCMTSIKNSGYYIKEMLMIMPVIFVLTALLDLWVPKEKISKFLGHEAKSLGTLVAFILGSVSAGPIYAAFPMCIMLHKKGASVRNLIIILSSWAVIKIPMLLNEMKFLGMQFMIIRWILTVLAILIFSWIAAKFIKSEDLPTASKTSPELSVNQNACMGCKLCTKIYPELLEMQNKKACFKHSTDTVDAAKLQQAANSCPVKAITFFLS